jgi:hypothetical protein
MGDERWEMRDGRMGSRRKKMNARRRRAKEDGSKETIEGKKGCRR